jgi:hypothetical protein
VPAHVALSARCETGARGQRERRRRPQGDDQKARLATRCDDGYLRDVFKRGGGGRRWGVRAVDVLYSMHWEVEERWWS